MAIENTLKNKTNSEKSRIKSQEISKHKHSGVFDSAEHGIKVEIIGDVTAINVNGLDGVQVFARAWKNGEQLGFSSDGSVEIERFRIFNPPILVNDPNGTIIRKWQNIITGELKQLVFKEDPIEAVRQSLAHTITLISKSGENIVFGKIGNTTDTFYPAAGANTPFDGYGNQTSASWSTVHGNANANGASVIYTSFYTEGAWRSGTSDYSIARSMTLFDTSTINDAATISSAILSLWIIGKVASPDTGAGIRIVTATPAATNNYALSDYSQFGTVSQTDDIAYTSMTTGAYNDFTLNATGLSNISKTGITKLGIRDSMDVNNSTPTVANYSEIASADTAGTTSDPKLVVTYTSVVNNGAGFFPFF
jgi:hypothetical protein